MRIMLVDEAGKEHYFNYIVGWQEELAGERVLFEEQWFIVSEEEVE